MSGSPLLIAILDDEEPVREALGRLFRSAGFKTEFFPLAKDFLESLDSHQPDCLVLDLHLPGLTGLDVLNHMVKQRIRVPTVMITGLDIPGMRENALASGADAYLLKPFDDTTLIDAVMTSIESVR
jgi:FixJ family two-component response regulator